MSGNKREKGSGNRGFWDGGTRGQGFNREASGRVSGYPGSRLPEKTGIMVDLSRAAAPQEGNASGSERSHSVREQRPPGGGIDLDSNARLNRR